MKTKGWVEIACVTLCPWNKKLKKSEIAPAKLIEKDL